jgi:hypothetical protein
MKVRGPAARPERNFWDPEPTETRTQKILGYVMLALISGGGAIAWRWIKYLL